MTRFSAAKRLVERWLGCRSENLWAVSKQPPEDLPPLSGGGGGGFPTASQFAVLTANIDRYRLNLHNLAVCVAHIL